MAKAIELGNGNGPLETVQVMLISQLVALFGAKKLADSMVIVIPDTGKAQFKPSAPYTVKSGAKKGETAQSKALFRIAEYGDRYEAQPVPFTQDNGDAAGLTVKVLLEVTAVSNDPKATCIEEAVKPQKAEIKAVA